MVIDATEAPWGRDTEQDSFGKLLPRDRVVGTSIADVTFEYVDRILEDDPRVRRFVATGQGMDGHGPAD